MINPGAEYKNNPSNNPIKPIIMILINNDLNLNTNEIHFSILIVSSKFYMTKQKLLSLPDADEVLNGFEWCHEPHKWGIRAVWLFKWIRFFSAATSWGLFSFFEGHEMDFCLNFSRDFFFTSRVCFIRSKEWPPAFNTPQLEELKYWYF